MTRYLAICIYYIAPPLSTIETGDRLGSLWFSISRDRLENTVSLGHTYCYPRSPLANDMFWNIEISQDTAVRILWIESETNAIWWQRIQRKWMLIKHAIVIYRFPLTATQLKWLLLPMYVVHFKRDSTSRHWALGLPNALLSFSQG